MSSRTVQRGNRRHAIPGTCNQTGNTAPRPSWPDAIRVLVHRIAHHLDYTDDQMWRLRDFPDPLVFFNLFIKTVPWFGEWYDQLYIQKAIAKGYPEEKWGLFSNGKGAAKVHNRLRYLCDEPGDTKTGKKRKYGISVEHPDNPAGNRRYVDARCSVEILRRLKMGETISQEEIEEWSNDHPNQRNQRQRKG